MYVARAIGEIFVLIRVSREGLHLAPRRARPDHRCPLTHGTGRGSSRQRLPPNGRRPRGDASPRFAALPPERRTTHRTGRGQTRHATAPAREHRGSDHSSDLGRTLFASSASAIRSPAAPALLARSRYVLSGLTRTARSVSSSPRIVNCPPAATPDLTT